MEFLWLLLLTWHNNLYVLRMVEVQNQKQTERERDPRTPVNRCGNFGYQPCDDSLVFYFVPAQCQLKQVDTASSVQRSLGARRQPGPGHGWRPSVRGYALQRRS